MKTSTWLDIKIVSWILFLLTVLKYIINIHLHLVFHADIKQRTQDFFRRKILSSFFSDMFFYLFVLPPGKDGVAIIRILPFPFTIPFMWSFS